MLDAFLFYLTQPSQIQREKVSYPILPMSKQFHVGCFVRPRHSTSVRPIIWNFSVVIILYCLIMIFFFFKRKLKSHYHMSNWILLGWFVCLFLEGGERREKERDRNIHWLPLNAPQRGSGWQPRCVPWLGNRTGDLSVGRPALNPLSHSSQGNHDFFFLFSPAIVSGVTFLQLVGILQVFGFSGISWWKI